MKLVLIGPPGSGKGTQAVLIKEEFGLPQISTGDILREAVRNGTELGNKAKEYMNSGQLVPDQLIIDLMSERLEQSDCEEGYILDGFPRTVKQAKALDELLEGRDETLDVVLSIELDDEEVVKRLTARRQCTKCGEGYHLEFKKPGEYGVCDKCGGELYQRDDDKEETIRERLSVYRNQTAPVLDYYEDKHLLERVDGKGSIEGVFEKLRSLIEKHAKN